MKYENVMKRFCELLNNEGIGYTVANLYDGYQWCNIDRLEGGDVVIHSGSYNNKKGYVESYGMPWDEGDVTSCSIEEMVDLITGRIDTPRNKYNYTSTDLFESLFQVTNNT